MKQYFGLRRHGIRTRIEAAIEASRGRVLSRADPTVAPFQFKAASAEGEEFDIVCYAFSANKYKQLGRPLDEHRFQIKYGSEFDRYHSIFVDPARTRVTLFIGVHLELDVFVGVDPRMHNPTWFSSSVEFKSEDLDRALATGWHGWERERSSARRKRAMPIGDLRTEAVVGFSPENFLRYVDFERHASGLDPGERLLLSDRIETLISAPRGSPKLSSGELLERQLGLNAGEILDVIRGRFRLLAAVRGGVAEHHLEKHLRCVPGITAISRFDEDGKPDFEVGYARRRFRIECKNVLRRGTTDGPRVDFQKTRSSKGDPCSRYYASSQFEILAACLHPLTENWEFRFSRTAALPPHPKCTGKLSERVIVAGDNWTSELESLLE